MAKDADVHDLILTELRYLREKVDGISRELSGDHALLQAHLDDEGNKPERTSVIVSTACLVVAILSVCFTAVMYANEKVSNENEKQRIESVDVQAR